MLSPYKSHVLIEILSSEDAAWIDRAVECMMVSGVDAETSRTECHSEAKPLGFDPERRGQSVLLSERGCL